MGVLRVRRVVFTAGFESALVAEDLGTRLAGCGGG